MNELLDFWFGDCRRTGLGRNQLWFAGGPALDDELRRRFGDAHAAATRGELDDWATEAPGLLALVILLDQLSRNLFRGTEQAFAHDAKARALCRRALLRGWDQDLHPFERAFLYLPLEHSEALADQEESVRQYQRLRDQTLGECGTDETLRFAREHHEIIRRFGRFPHRNQILGRPSTDEEMAYLAQGGARFGQ